MKCPSCGEHTPDFWQFLQDVAPIGDNHRSSIGGSPIATDGTVPSSPSRFSDASWKSTVAVDFMYCANQECGELVLRVHESSRSFVGAAPITQTATWIVRPREGSASRPVNPLVPEPYRRDFNEAASILDRSPKMSAVLSRRILADLLEEYAGRDEFLLGTRLEKFAKDDKYPTDVRLNAQSLNEIAKLGAHTKKDDQAEIIEVDLEEAEWTLDLVMRLFDIFIVARATDAEMRGRIEAKRQRAGPNQSEDKADKA